MGFQIKHGMSRSSENLAWRQMKARCCNPKNGSFKDYGDRGISVCARWMESFEAFFADMGPRPSAGHSLDRERSEGNYEPGNCRWATRQQQNENRRNVGQSRQSATVIANRRASGEPLKSIAIDLGISYRHASNLMYKHGKSLKAQTTEATNESRA